MISDGPANVRDDIDGRDALVVAEVVSFGHSLVSVNAEASLRPGARIQQLLQHLVLVNVRLEPQPGRGPALLTLDPIEAVFSEDVVEEDEPFVVSVCHAVVRDEDDVDDVGQVAGSESFPDTLGEVVHLLELFLDFVRVRAGAVSLLVNLGGVGVDQVGALGEGQVEPAEDQVNFLGVVVLHGKGTRQLLQRARKGFVKVLTLFWNGNQTVGFVPSFIFGGPGHMQFIALSPAFTAVDHIGSPPHHLGSQLFLGSV